MGPLITADELHRLIVDHSANLRILDVRWKLGRSDGRAEYQLGHIPGAVYADMETELSEPGQPASEGRHPLPRLERLQEAARRWGVHDGDTVVVYDDAANTSSARAWWLLRHAGVTDVRVLDGSFASWTRAGLPTEEGGVRPPPGTVSLRYGSLKHLTIDDAADFPQYGTLLDTRAAERFRGEVEPYDPRPGHIPGAVSAPTTGNVDSSGRFRSPADLRSRFLGVGVDPERPVASYCGSGINGCHSTLALEIAGFDAVLYPGSFSEWSNNTERPVIAEGEAMKAVHHVAGVPFPMTASQDSTWVVDNAEKKVKVRAAPHSDIFADPLAEGQVGAETLLNAATLLADLPEGDFQFSAEVSVDFLSTFDAGVLLLWMDDRHWAKLCFEHSPEGEPMVVSVVTRDVSDDANSFTVNGKTIWLRISRTHGVYAYHASHDGQTWRLIRIFALHAPGRTAQFGFEAQSPTGDGCSVTFAGAEFTTDRLTHFRDGT